MNGGGNSFYVNTQNETIVDMFSSPPAFQNQLLDELRKCDQLVQLDWRYAQMVAGASKMPMNMIWVARNQDEPVNDTDLAAFKDLAWNEFVKRRYLSSVSGASSVRDTAASMLEIVREMNLQRRRFQIMGLHEQVEASEIHLILHLCQAGILRTDKYRTMANRFRRHDKLFEAFGLAVGAFVCASAPFTLGAATTRYERDLQYEYKKNATALFVYVLQQNNLGMNSAAEFDEDYVSRIAKLIVVWPDDDDGGRRRIGSRPRGKKKGGKKDDDDDDDDGDLSNTILDSVAVAQGQADKAFIGMVELKADVKRKEELLAEKLENLTEKLQGKIDGCRGDLVNESERTKSELKLFILQNMSADDKQALNQGIQETLGKIKTEMKSEMDKILSPLREQNNKFDKLAKQIFQVSQNQDLETTILSWFQKTNAALEEHTNNSKNIDELHGMIKKLTENLQAATISTTSLKESISRSEEQHKKDLEKITTDVKNAAAADIKALKDSQLATLREVQGLKDSQEKLEKTIASMQNTSSDQTQQTLQPTESLQKFSEQLEAFEKTTENFDRWINELRDGLMTTEQMFTRVTDNLSNDLSTRTENYQTLLSNFQARIESLSKTIESMDKKHDKLEQELIDMSSNIQEELKAVIEELVSQEIENMQSSIFQINPGPSRPITPSPLSPGHGTSVSPGQGPASQGPPTASGGSTPKRRRRDDDGNETPRSDSDTGPDTRGDERQQDSFPKQLNMSMFAKMVSAGVDAYLKQRSIQNDIRQQVQQIIDAERIRPERQAGQRENGMDLDPTAQQPAAAQPTIDASIRTMEERIGRLERLCSAEETTGVNMLDETLARLKAVENAMQSGSFPSAAGVTT